LVSEKRRVQILSLLGFVSWQGLVRINSKEITNLKFSLILQKILPKKGASSLHMSHHQILFCTSKILFISFNCHWFLHVYRYCAKYGTGAHIPCVPYLAHSEKLITSIVYCVIHVPFLPLTERQAGILNTYWKFVRVQYSKRNIRYTKVCQFFIIILTILYCMIGTGTHALSSTHFNVSVSSVLSVRWGNISLSIHLFHDFINILTIKLSFKHKKSSSGHELLASQWCSIKTLINKTPWCPPFKTVLLSVKITFNTLSVIKTSYYNDVFINIILSIVFINALLSINS
jgi:hypothetical protein